MKKYTHNLGFNVVNDDLHPLQSIVDDIYHALIHENVNILHSFLGLINLYNVQILPEISFKALGHPRFSTDRLF